MPEMSTECKQSRNRKEQCIDSYGAGKSNAQIPVEHKGAMHRLLRSRKERYTDTYSCVTGKSNAQTPVKSKSSSVSKSVEGGNWGQQCGIVVDTTEDSVEALVSLWKAPVYACCWVLASECGGTEVQSSCHAGSSTAAGDRREGMVAGSISAAACSRRPMRRHCYLIYSNQQQKTEVKAVSSRLEAQAASCLLCMHSTA
eukprot:1153984-Pelagomonas_calceolata.AAC.1